RAHGEIEQMLADTSRLLSSLTDSAAVVVSRTQDAAHVRSVQVVPLTAHTALLVLVLANGVVEKRTIDLHHELSEDQLAVLITHLSSHLIGQPVSSMAGIPAAPDPDVDRVVRGLVAAGAGRSDDEVNQVFVGGASRMAAAFDAVETVRSVLTIL